MTYIGYIAFAGCSGLSSITFEGDAPTLSSDVFTGSDSVTVYYYSHNSGWSSTVAGRPAVGINLMTFTLNGDSTEYSVTGCDQNASGSLDIPSTYNGLPVTSIGNQAFYGCSSLTSITIPDGVTSIGIPNSINVVDVGAFTNCSSLTSITIPDSVTYIGYNAFAGCSGLSSITIPDSVTSIGSSAFAGCSGLSSITIPNSVTYIGSYAFQSCSGLSSITIPNSVTYIVNYAFQSCSGLSSIIFEGDAPTFGTGVFSGSNSATIYYYDDATGFSTPTFQGRPSQILTRGNTQFQIIEGNFTWTEAKLDAEARGGRLAVLNTQEKIDAANEYLLSLSTWNNAYIGLTDEEVEGSWKWVTGELLTVDNWNSGEPNGSTNENYGQIIGSYHSSRLLWNDSRITSAYSYILEAIPAPEPLAPVLDLETLYESNSGESITIDATPTDGYPSSYTYQWSFKAVGYNSYFVISSSFGGTAANYQISGDSGNNGTWKVEVSNDSGTTSAEFNYRVYADSDNDGLSDGQEEFVLGTDPNDNDSDDDSLLDGAETNTGTWVSASETGTDPLSNDSDSDGLNDGIETNTAEYIDASDTGTNPNDSDTDNDGLLDGAETNTNVYVSTSDTGTHPLYADSDADGYSDYVETNTGTWTSSDDTGTDPNLGDTDNDGIIDGRETNTGIFVSATNTGTNPFNTDSDGDGFTDKFEIDTSYDPTSSDDTPDAYSFIETAVEVNFYGANGGTYRIEHTDDIESDVWVTVENDIEGSSGLIERLYSTDDYSRRFFRVVRTDQ